MGGSRAPSISCCRMDATPITQVVNAHLDVVAPSTAQGRGAGTVSVEPLLEPAPPAVEPWCRRRSRGATGGVCLGGPGTSFSPVPRRFLLFAATRGAVRVAKLGNAMANFGVFFTAFIIGQGLGELVARGPTLVSERASWVKGSLFPLELFAPMAVGVSLYRMVPGGLLGVAAIMIGAGVLVGLGALVGFASGLGLAIIWGTALGLALSAIGVYLRDAVLAAQSSPMGLTFVSPLYVDQTTSGLLASLVTLNPLTVR